MGLDTSAHPIDVALFRDRLVPFVKDGKPIDDLIERAAHRALLADRAATWRLSTLQFSWTLQHAQEAVVPQVTEHYPDPEQKLSFIARMLGRKPRMKSFTHPERVPGLAGYDSELAAFGRPYFMPAGDTNSVLALYDRYLKADSEADIDAIAREMVAVLNAGALDFPAGTRPEVVAATKALQPFDKHILPVRSEGDGQVLTAEQHLRRLTREIELWRVIFDNRNSKSPMPDQYLAPDAKGDRTPASQYVLSLPLQMTAFAAELIPGWMSRGYGFATSLFHEIGVNVSHIVETPEALFGDLVEAAPGLRKVLRTSIHENFSLGGYVPPHKMQPFVDLLAKHRRALIQAFEKTPPANIEDIASDYTKIFEPATYALRNGYGYLEGAEIYSAPLGWAN